MNIARVLAFLLASLIVVSTTSSSAIKQDQRSYKLSVSGYFVANANSSLHQEGGEWRAQRSTVPEGLIADLFAEDVEETSRFNIIDGQIKPIEYTYHNAAKDPIVVRFDNNEAHFPDGRAVSTAEFDHVVDVGALPYFFAIVPPGELEGRIVGIVNKRRVAGYKIGKTSQESIDIEGFGRLETLKVTAQSMSDPDRYSTFWLNPKDFLPYQVEQFNKRRFVLKLSALGN